MDLPQKPQFVQLLAGVLASYAKPLPERAILDAWWSNLQPYPLPVVTMAFAAYCDENGEFAPVPAGIAKRCRVMDGRPAPEEAWAMALASRDEAETVVWTSDMAQAFAVCRPVLEASGAISARMTFLETYQRLVTQARAERRPAQWSASLGHDPERRPLALQAAVRAGLLGASHVAVCLPAPAIEASTPSADGEARQRLQALLATLRAGSADAAHRLALERDTALREARAAVSVRKKEVAAQVAEYRQVPYQSTHQPKE